MYVQLNAQLAEAKEQLARLAQLKASLAPAREHLTEEAHRVQGIENRLAEVENQIQSLESFSLQSVMDSLMCRKEGKRNHLREELARLSPKVEAGERTLLELDSAVKEIEAEIASLSNTEETYKTICDQKSEQILADGGEPAKQLEESATQLTVATNKRQSLHKCFQVAKNLVDRLRTMGSAWGRANTKKMRYGPLGVIGYVAVNAIQRQSAGPAVRRAREGLQEFAHSIEALNIVSGCARDEELVRLGTVLAHSNADLDGGGTLSPLIDVIHQAIGLVQNKLEELEPTVASLETQRLELIENA
jgi:division protein CdvB (Snf7/Vps24/ESCRT-III family)